MAGRFITLEGVEAAGKSLQAARLAGWLEEQNRQTLVTREPGGTPGAEEIRDLLVKGGLERWGPLAEALLFSAARADHLERIIRPALAAGAWVVSDRFADSTAVYQGMVRGLPAKTIKALQTITAGALQPDLTLILDLDEEAAQERIAARGGVERRFESAGKDFQRQVRAGFLKIAEDNPKRCAVIPAGGGEDEIAEAIRDAVARRLMHG